MNDQELVSEYLRGDEKAFHELVNRYLQPIYNFVFSSVRDAAQAEDITQEVFIKAWTHLRRFDLSRNFKVWLYAIAKNCIFDFLRKKKTIPFSLLEKEDEVYEILDKEPQPDEILRLSDSGKTLDEALAKLSLDYREVLLLYYRDGFNFREIAEILKTSVNTIKSRHLRATAMLKKILHPKE